MPKFFYTAEIAGLYVGTSTFTVTIEAESLDAGKPAALQQAKRDFRSQYPGLKGSILNAVILYGFMATEDLLKNEKYPDLR